MPRTPSTTHRLDRTRPTVRERLRLVVGGLQALPERQRAALVMRAFEGWLPHRHGREARHRVLRAAGPALDIAYPTLRELIPIVDLATQDRDTIVGVAANVGSVGNGRVISPGGFATGHLTGIPTVWNETVAGWTRRLPTNRSNSYQREIADGGPLESFDWRNTGNPAVLPAFGGAPLCKEQGSWTFRGRTAYFPRLLRSSTVEPHTSKTA